MFKGRGKGKGRGGSRLVLIDVKIHLQIFNLSAHLGCDGGEREILYKRSDNHDRTMGEQPNSLQCRDGYQFRHRRHGTNDGIDHNPA